MDRNLQARLQEVLASKRARKRWLRFVSVVLAIAMLTTSYSLIMPASTLDGYTCGMVEHTHSEENGCYTETQTLICTEDEGGHVHADACYEEQESLVCELEESEEHQHTAECYQKERVLVCKQAEGQGHQHTSECYEVEKTFTCPKTEHTHTEACYADTQADVETEADWTSSFANVNLTGSWADDVLAIADSQLGYKESTRNYSLADNGRKKGYTRYGAWYGDPYGDWCAMFVSFCLSYAGVDEGLMPRDSNCNAWIEKLQAKGIYHGADDAAYKPEPGDLVFFDWDGDGKANHVGLVYEVSKDADGNIDKIKTIEGNYDDAVTYNTYAATDTKLFGYGALPENPNRTVAVQTGYVAAPAPQPVPVRAPSKAPPIGTVTSDPVEPTGCFFPDRTQQQVLDAYREYLDVKYYINDPPKQNITMEESGKLPDNKMGEKQMGLGLDCSGLVTYVRCATTKGNPHSDYYNNEKGGLGITGDDYLDPLNNGTGNIAEWGDKNGCFVMAGNSRAAFEAAYKKGTIKPSDVVIFYYIAYNADGSINWDEGETRAKHAAIISENKKIIEARDWGIPVCETVRLDAFDDKTEYHNDVKKASNYWRIYRGTTPPTTSLEIIKTCDDPNGPVADIEFEITKPDGTTERRRTNSEGKITITNPEIGMYTVKENPPTGWKADPDSQTKMVVANQVNTFRFRNYKEPDNGELWIKKTSNDNNIKGISFTVTGPGFNKTDVTDGDGYLKFEDLQPGTYKVTENPPPGYHATPLWQNVTVEEGKTAKAEFYNWKRSVIIQKKCENGPIEGITFTITYPDGTTKTEKTNKDGQITLGDAPAGHYTVVEIPQPGYYAVPDKQEFDLLEKDTVKTVKFENFPLSGKLQVIKWCEGKPLENIEFRVTGTSLTGEKVNKTGKTNAQGIVEFDNLPITADGKPYTVEEINVDAQYVAPVPQEAIITNGEITKKEFDNKPKYFALQIIKKDKETGETPQGDASLKGAVFGIYKDGVQLDTYTTDEKGRFTTKWYKCGPGYTYKEEVAPPGYELDTTEHKIEAEPQLYQKEFNYINGEPGDTVKKNYIHLYKHLGEDGGGLEQPEDGAEFQIYLKAAESYQNAKPTERDIIVTDKTGYAKSKMLPYGDYVVHQTKGRKGSALIKDFTVTVTVDKNNPKPKPYLADNEVFQSYIKVVKKDAETGKVIPYAGAEFQIMDPNNKLVSMKINYPEPTVISTFVTNKDGYIITPEKLRYGEGYHLIEVKAPTGYVLDKTPVKFDVDVNNMVQENARDVIKVEKNDRPQKGKITVIKTGEVFSSVTEANNMYKPVYTNKGFEGAVYDIVAAEDIVTLDGTLRTKKGTVVATITTGKDGTATTGELYLGKYAVTEKKAPHGLVLNVIPQQVELTYGDPTAKVVFRNVNFNNERQRVKITLDKIMEQDEKFKLGMNDEILSVQFGLYAAADITAADGKKIPKDGLIEIINCNEKGEATFTTDLPVGSKLYVKEYSTDKHYLLDETTYPVQFDYAGQTVQTVNIKVNKDDQPFKNEFIRGKVVGLKVDPDGVKIQGAVFGLFKVDEKEFTEKTSILPPATTDEEGKFAFNDVIYGDYIVREIKPAKGFVLNETLYPVTIAKDEDVVEIKAVNKHVEGHVKTTKVDKDYPKNKLTGATFEIYKDVDGDKKYDPKVDEFVDEMTEVSKGVYLLKNLRYGGYFLYEKKAPKGFLKDDKYHFFEINKDGETVEVENEAGVGFINKPETGGFEMTKRDVATGKPLPNAGFRIKDDKGKTVAEGRTDSNGVAIFDELRVGKYTYEEFDAPDGYIIDTTPFPFEIKEHGQVVKAVMTNEKRPETPNTGDFSGISLWLCVNILGLLGLISCNLIYSSRRRRYYLK